eukprot:scaffold212865_cov48-Prasinocladus_malaysianus.AAC.4
MVTGRRASASGSRSSSQVAIRPLSTSKAQTRSTEQVPWSGQSRSPTGHDGGTTTVRRAVEASDLSDGLLTRNTIEGDASRLEEIALGVVGSGANLNQRVEAAIDNVICHGAPVAYGRGGSVWGAGRVAIALRNSDHGRTNQ